MCIAHRSSFVVHWPKTEKRIFEIDEGSKVGGFFPTPCASKRYYQKAVSFVSTAVKILLCNE